MTEPTLNYKDLLNQAADESQSIFTPEYSISSNLSNLLTESIRLSNKRLFEPIILSYLLLPSGLCKVLPYLACIGKAGSGKSSIGFIASGLHGTQSLQGNSTFASLRNWVNNHAFWDSEGKEPRNCALVWDDVEERFFYEAKMYSFLKSGYSLKSSLCTIAGERGEILSFSTFCPKILSSIQPFYQSGKFSEIARRLIVIPSTKIDELTAESLAQYDESLDEEIELIDLKSCNLKDYKDQYFQFWNNSYNCKKFIDTASKLRSRDKGFKLPKGFSSQDWELCPDLIASGVAHDIWDIQTGVQLLNEYFTYKKDHLMTSSSALSNYLKSYIKFQNAITGNTDLQPQLLRDTLKVAAQNGELDINPTLDKVAEEMKYLGYSLVRENMVTTWKLSK